MLMLVCSFKKVFKQLSFLALSAALSACTLEGMFKDASRATPMKLKIMGVAKVPSGNCQSFTIENHNDMGELVVLPEKVSIQFLQLGGTYFSDAACAQPTTDLSLPKNIAAKVFYYKNDSNGLFKLDLEGIESEVISSEHEVLVEPNHLGISSPASFLAGECGSVLIQALDASESVGPVHEDLLIHLTENANAEFYADASCSVPLTQVQLLRGQGQVQVYLQDMVAETVTALSTDASSSIISGVKNLVIHPDVPERLEIVELTSTMAGYCQALSVESKDQFGNASPLLSSITLQLSETGNGSFYADAACSTPMTDMLMLVGTDRQQFYYLNSTVEAASITVSDGSASLIGDSQNIAVQLGSAYKLQIAGASTQHSITCGEFLVNSLDMGGNLVNVASSVTVNLSDAMAQGQFYSDAQCLTQVSSVQINAASNSIAFYYRDGTAEAVVLSVVDNAGGLQGDTHNLTITPLTKIFRSVGPGKISALATGAANAMSISAGVASFATSLPEHVGVGDAIQYDSNGDGSIDAIAFISERSQPNVYAIRSASGGEPIPASNDQDWAIYRAYTSLANAEAGIENTSIDISVRNFDPWTGGRDLVANNEQWNIACYGDGVEKTGVQIENWVTSETNYLKFYSPVASTEVGVSQRHKGYWQPGVCTMVKPSGASGRAFISSIANIWVEGFLIQDDVYSIAFHGGTPGKFWVANNILVGNPSSSFANCGVCIYGISGVSVKSYVWNNVSISRGSAGYGFIISDHGAEGYFYNNTAYGNKQGFHEYSAKMHLKNNISYNNSTNYWVWDSGFESDSSNNLSGPTQNNAPGANPRNAVTVNFVNPLARDFRLKRDDFGAKDFGADLAVDPHINSVQDFALNTRSGTWDIGASEYSTSSDFCHDKLLLVDFAAYGNGSLNDPHLICTAAQMASIGSNTTAWNKHFVLMTDLDMSGYNQSNYTPIGTPAQPFAGSFDGNGFTIANLALNSPAQDYVGLFGYVANYGYKIQNIRASNFLMMGNNNVGGLVGYSYFGNFHNLSITGSISGTQYVGGLIGRMFFTKATFLSSSASLVGSSHNIGGVFGQAFFSNYIANAIFDGASVSGQLNSTGIGTLLASSIENGYAITNVTSTTSETGGLAQNIWGRTDNMFSVANVTGNSPLAYAGRVGLALANEMESDEPDIFYASSGSCVDSGPGGPCNSIGVSVDTSIDYSYFYDKDNAPLNKWNFITDWVEYSDTFPKFQDYLKPNQFSGCADHQSKSPFAGGTGSIIDPYLICTATQFNNIGSNLAYLNQHFALADNIDMTGLVTYNIVGTSTNRFRGSLDGRGYTLSNLSINRSGTDRVALFGYTYGAMIANLKIHNFTLTGKNKVATITGESEGSYVNNVRVTGSNIVGSGVVGGIIGNARGTYITNASVSAAISTPGDRAGGFVGFSDINLGVLNSYFVGSVSGNDFVGGIVGGLYFADRAFKNVFVSANISGVGPTGVGTIFGVLSGGAVHTGLYYDSQKACTGCTLISGNAVDTALNPNYFYQRSNEPMLSWPFDFYWLENAADYPTLK